MNYKGFIGAKATFPSHTWGELTVESQSFTAAVDGDLVVTIGQPEAVDAPLVRIHSECVFAEAFDSALCDCSDQLHMALSMIKREGQGLLFYLRLDGRGIGLSAKVKATSLEVMGMDTYESRTHLNLSPEARSFDSIGQYLFERGFRRVRLLTNNPLKIEALHRAGIVIDTVPLVVPTDNPHVQRLYETKARRFGHDIATLLSGHSHGRDYRG